MAKIPDVDLQATGTMSIHNATQQMGTAIGEHHCLVNQRLLLQREYLIAENRVLRSHLTGRLRLSDTQRSTLAEIAKRLGRKHLAEVAYVAKPDTILAWHRRLIARNFDGSKHRAYPGRPRIEAAIEALVVRLARENSNWGYDRIAGLLTNLGHHISDQTIGNILKRHGIAPAPKRSQNATWKRPVHDGSFH